MPITELISNWVSCRKAILATGRRILIGLDFDGTLAPLVNHPDDVRVPEATLNAINQLRRSEGIDVVVISGRELHDLEQHLPVGLDMVGLCGLQSRIGGIRFPPDDAEEFERLFSRVIRRLGPLAEEMPGAWIEPKRFAATVHLRRCTPSHQANAARHVEAALRELIREVRILQGPASIELFPRRAPDKGGAIERYAALLGLSHPLIDYFGDAENDSPAWTVAQKSGGTAWIVGSENWREGLTPLASPMDVGAVLERLADHFS